MHLVPSLTCLYSPQSKQLPSSCADEVRWTVKSNFPPAPGLPVIIALTYFENTTDTIPKADVAAVHNPLKFNIFFPGRAKKLYELNRNHGSIDGIDPKTRRQLETSCYKRSFKAVYQETKTYFVELILSQIELTERDPKYKMSLIFRLCFAHSLRAVLAGNIDHKVKFQVHTGPALGDFNQWINGTDSEPRKNRDVESIGKKLMNATATLLNRKFEQMKHEYPIVGGEYVGWPAQMTIFFVCIFN